MSKNLYKIKSFCELFSFLRNSRGKMLSTIHKCEKSFTNLFVYMCIQYRYYAFNVSHLCKHSACKLEKQFYTMYLSNTVIYLIKILYWELYQFFPLNWMRLRKSSIDWPLQVRKYIALSVCFVERQWLLTWIHTWSFSYKTMEMFLILVSLWDCS